MIKPTAMACLLLINLSIFTWLIVPRIRILWALQQENLFDKPLQRFLGMLKFAVGQYRMPRESVAGTAHIVIYAGFLIVSIATLTHFVHAFQPEWHPPGLSGHLASGYAIFKDTAELLVLFGVFYGLWRRLKPTPSRVGRSWEGVFVLGMIFMLMVTDFVINGAHRLRDANSPETAGPGAQLGAWLLSPFSPTQQNVLGEVSYWLHCAGVLLFLNFLPLGKHFHIITSFFNVYFRNLHQPGYLPKVDLENSSQIGIRSSKDLTWSMGLDVYSCTECGRCNVFCPTVLTQKPLSHRQLNLDLKHALFAEKDAILSKDPKKHESLPALVGGRISAETIWACTTCGACEQECPVYIENVPRIIQMRQHKVLMEGDISPELTRVYKGLENNSNPWGLSSNDRDAWAKDFTIPRVADIAKDGVVPLVYWIGCAGSFDDRNKKITLAMVHILNAAQVPFAILGKEEGCTGDPARRTGNEYLFQTLAQANVDLLNGYQVKKILTHCPHCLHTIKSEYPQFGGNFEVVHHTQLIQSLIEKKELPLTKEVKTTLAWHDSCYLGRYHDIYDAPREVAKAVPGVELVELPRNKSRSVCCGAGGGRFWVEETIGERINVHRAKEVVAANTQAVGSACPFCLVMMRDGLGSLGKEKVAALDIAEIVAQAL